MSNQISLTDLPAEALSKICFQFPSASSRELRALQETCTVLRDVVNYCYQKNLQVILCNYRYRGTQIDLIINSIRCKVSNPFELGSESISKIQQYIVRGLRNIGFGRCPSCPVGLRDILQYNLTIENMNLQKAWENVICSAVIDASGILAANLPQEEIPAMLVAAGIPPPNAPAAEIRAWMIANQNLLQGITLLDLSGLELTCVPKEIGLFTRLQVLYLNTNKLIQLPKDLFATLTQLKGLDLSQNKLTYLPEGLFSPLTQLEGLSLYQNELTQLPKNLFAPLTQLKGLDLSDNQLKQLPEKLFAPLTQLEELNLNGNALTHVPKVPSNLIENRNLREAWEKRIWSEVTMNVPGEELFAMLEATPATNASGAEIRAWMNANQDLLQGVTELYLAHLELTCVPKEIGMFTGLQRLDLCDNQLTQIPEDLFVSLTQLKELNLSCNQLAQLPEDLFAPLIRLKELNLWQNMLTHLPDGLFATLTQLKELNLGKNKLTHLPEGLFASLTQLKKLLLCNNQLTRLPENLFAYLDDLLEFSWEGNDRLLHALQILVPDNLIIIREFERYQCQSPFAQFYKDVAQCKSLAAITTSFGALDKERLQDPILEMIRTEAGADVHHGFDDMFIFCGALKKFVTTTIENLSEEQKNAVQARIFQMAIDCVAVDRWPTQGSVLLLIDAMSPVLGW